ncbi:hypothetical protein ACGFWI_08885 [Streptomyces sp. NPDC048434]|uniref:hypothetical protein n=1 Tax=Streptomyces sp. NPDC048434 TaxID=3365549 RepID=UPI003714CA67
MASFSRRLRVHPLPVGSVLGGDASPSPTARGGVLYKHTSVLLLDEPTASMDPKAEDVLRDHLR